MIVYEGESVITLTVNGEPRTVMARPSDVLLDVLRKELGLTGAKSGCKNGDCGACTVLIDGWPAKSCLVLAVECVGHTILTVEGLGGTAPVQQAFVAHNAFQCGYCTPGFLMVSHALFAHHPQPEEYQLEEWLQSNICRCTSYNEIRAALNSVIDAKT